MAKQRANTEQGYCLNEAQALLTCMLADTPKASDIRREVIRFIIAAKRKGQPIPPTPLVDELLSAFGPLAPPWHSWTL